MNWKIFWEFVTAFAVCLGISGGSVSMVALFLGTEWWSESKSIAITHFSYGTIILFLAFLLTKKSSDPIFRSPRVKRVLEDGMLLTEGFAWGGVGMAVTVFVNDEGYERLLAHGEILNKQENGLVSIKLNSEDENEFLSEAKSHKADLVIKPGQIRW
ncbi:MAG: hypothetical protein QNJ16_15795 [Rhodobacter sp.]|nr:hypothetical protein [Rhodobacter sp.]